MKVINLLLVIFFAPAVLADNFENLTVQKGESVAGVPLEEYANIWWQWTYTMPEDLSPVRDVTGENCHQGQNGDVWFLAGGYGSSKISRKCTIPEGKHIFFPIINMTYYAPVGSEVSCETVKSKAGLNNDEAVNVSVQLDGLSSENSSGYRLSSPDCFDLYGLIPKELGAPKIYPSASDGFWVMLKPLNKGKHILKFSAKYVRSEGAYSKMVQDIYYEITIE